MCRAIDGPNLDSRQARCKRYEERKRKQKMPVAVWPGVCADGHDTSFRFELMRLDRLPFDNFVWS